ncbi:MAG: response regulator [Selenomonadaceae bacterium]|nr:response regulator [Selenomonadaceae bacterium]
MRNYYSAAAVFSCFFLLLLYIRMRHLRVFHNGAGQFKKFLQSAIGFTVVDCLWGLSYAGGYGSSVSLFTVCAYLYFAFSVIVCYKWMKYTATYLASEAERNYLNKVGCLISIVQLVILAANPFTGEVFTIGPGTVYNVGFMRTVIFGMQAILYLIISALLAAEKKTGDEKNLYRYALGISFLPLVSCFLSWGESDSPYYSIGCMTIVLCVFLLNVTQMLIIDNKVIRQQRDELDREYNTMKDAYYTAGKAGEAKREFLAMISRDMRTPMNSIIGLSTIAGAHIHDSERVEDCLRKIKESSQSILKLFNEVMDMDKVEDSGTNAASENIVIRQFIENLSDEAGAMARTKNQRLAISVKDIVHNVVLGDAERIKQCFDIVVGNAVKYSPDGGNISITIGETSSAYDGFACYEFTVEDNGVGMDRKQLAKVFDPFDREDTVKSGRAGLGLGLVIAQNIVTMMNGVIKIDSTPQVGTKVYFNLFLELPEKVETKDENLIGTYVLILDESMEDSEQMLQSLGQVGIKGEFVDNAEEAVKRIKEHHGCRDDYSALIVNWKIPGNDGMAVAKQMQEAVGEYQPVVLAYSYDTEELERQAVTAGVDGIISKPLYRSGLRHLFNEVLGKEKAKANGDTLNADFSNIRALLVEDNELNREITTELLSLTGMQVDSADNGQVCVDKFTGSQPGWYDVIFMDVEMPVMDGYEATRRIRELNTEYAKQIPIFAMTANVMSEDVIKAKNAGMNEHVPKPFDMKKLVAVMRNYFR